MTREPKEKQNDKPAHDIEPERPQRRVLFLCDGCKKRPRINDTCDYRSGIHRSEETFALTCDDYQYDAEAHQAWREKNGETHGI